MIGKALVGLARAGVHAYAIRQAEREAQLEALREARRARGRGRARRRAPQETTKAPCTPCAAKAYAQAMFQYTAQRLGHTE